MTKNITINLDVFRAADTLRWKQHTVFAPHRGDDGTLIANGGHRLPLDTWTPDRLTHGRENWPPMTANVGIAVVDPDTLEDTREAVCAWCREHLGRDDIKFED